MPSLPAKGQSRKPKNGGENNSPLLFGADPRNLILSFILFLITLSYILPAYSAIGSFIAVSFSILIIIYTIAYGMMHRSRTARPKTSAITAASFYLSILLFISATILYISLGQASLYNFFQIEYIASYLVMFLLLFFILQLYFYSKDKRVRFSVIAIAIVLIAIYFTPYLVNYKADDEEKYGEIE